jgi:hypothetical protein
MKAQTLANILEKLQMIKKAREVYKSNVRALDIERQTSSALVEAILSRNPSSSSEKMSSNKARVYLETLRSVEPWIIADSRFDREKARVESISYPALRVRLTIGGFQGCSPKVNNDNITSIIREALADVVSVDEKAWDITINIKSLTCSSTEIPNQLAQKVNSTDVAGHNQEES